MAVFRSVFNRVAFYCLAVTLLLLIGDHCLAIAAEARVVISASVASEQPMNFVLVEKKSCAGKSGCPRWLAGEGSFQADTPARLEEALQKLDGKTVPLFLNSPGGSYESAMEVGHLLAAHQIPVTVKTTRYPDCTEIYMLCRQVEGRKSIALGKASEDNARCDFACVFALAAGKTRSVPLDLFMQMPVLSVEPTDATSGFVIMMAEPTPDYLKRIRDYAGRYGVPREDGISLVLPTPDELPGSTEALPPTPASEPISPAPARISEKLIIAASLGTGRPMDFVLLERADCVGQTGCLRWISAEGMIETQTPDAFRSFLASTKADGLPLFINSRGGDYEAAMKLGRMARAAHLKIGLGRPAYGKCGGSAGCRAQAAKSKHSPGIVRENGVRCDLACVFFLAGGEDRRMPEDSHLTMPKLRLLDEDAQAALRGGIIFKTGPKDGPLRQNVQAFLDEMGMYKSLFIYGVNAKLTELEPVSQADSSLNNVVSNLLPPSRLLTGDIAVAALPPVKPAAVRLPEYYIPKKTVSSDMRFYVVTTPSYECNGECKSWIAGIGEITAKSPASLRKVLKSIGKRRLPVILHSQGGSVEAAMQIGRMIRQRQLSVSLGMTSIDRCGGAIGDCAAELPKGAALQGRVLAAGAYCLSACPLIFAGGVERVSSGYSFLGVHQITTVRQIYKIKYMTSYRVKNGKRTDVRRREVGRSFQGTEKTTAMTKAFRRGLLNYLAEMGVDGALLDRMKEAGPEDMRMLTTTEALSLHVMTKEGNVLELIAAQ